MNITPFDIYIWQLSDSVKCALGAFAWIMAAPSAICIFARFIEEAKTLKAGIICAIIAILFGAASILSPSSKTIAMMYVIPEIANSKVVREDIPQIYEAAIEALKENLKNAAK